MKYILKIIAYLFLLLLLTSEDCSDEMHRPSVSEQQRSMFEKLEDNFTAVVPPVEDLDAMERRSVQKFRELIEYLEVYSDTAYNDEFRQEARKMISKAFLSEMDLQQFLAHLNLQEDTNRLLVESPQHEMNVIKLDSISILHSFTSTGPSEFSSEMYYAVSGISENYEGQIKVVVTKRPKQFGEKRLLVWEQFFQQ